MSQSRRVSSWLGRKQRPVRRFVRPLLEALEDRITPSVLTPGSGSQLVADINGAAGATNTTIQLTGGKTYSVASQATYQGASNGGTLTIEGTGGSPAIISAQDLTRFLKVNGGNVVLKNVEITGFVADAADGGFVTPTSSKAPPGKAGLTVGGAALANFGGRISLSNVSFSNNVANGNGVASGKAPASLNAEGGAIASVGGSITFDAVSFNGNSALGGSTNPSSKAAPGVTAGFAKGGAIFASNTSLFTQNSSGSTSTALLTMTDNLALGGAGVATSKGKGTGSNGGFAQGGGLFMSGGVAILNDASIGGGVGNSNIAQGGGGANGTSTGGGTGGDGGIAQGGGVFLTSGANVTLTSSSVTYNKAVTGNGGNGGTPGGSGGNAGPGSPAKAPPPGPGGAPDFSFSAGGGIFAGSDTVLKMYNSTVGNNSVDAGFAGLAGTGSGKGGKSGSAGSVAPVFGGGLEIDGTASLINDTIAFNTLLNVPGSEVGKGPGKGGGATLATGSGLDIGKGGSVTATNLLVASNAGAPQVGVEGTLTGQTNIISPDPLVVPNTFIASDNVFLGTLTQASNGTWYYAVLPGSSAIIAEGNAGVLSIIGSTDQINFARPTPGNITIGAIEYNSALAAVGVNVNSLTVSPSATSISLSATLTPPNGFSGSVNEGTVTFSILDSKGNVVGSVSANVSGNSASTVLSGLNLTAGTTYTIDATYSDAGGKFVAGSVTPGTLTVTNASSMTSATSGSNTSPTVVVSPPSALSSSINLYFNVIAFVLDQNGLSAFSAILNLPTTTQEALSLAEYYYPIAGPLGNNVVTLALNVGESFVNSQKS
jgi:hypothetical protein